jgi:hypothetical protein
MFYSNISPEILIWQSKVFQSLGLNVTQLEKNGQQHGEFIDEQMNLAHQNDVMFIVDIDCFPLNVEVVNHAVNFAKNGGLWGCGQVSNHLQDTSHKFAAPMFHAIAKKTWIDMGSPSYARDELCAIYLNSCKGNIK